METYNFELPPQNEIFKFIFTKNYNYRWKATCLKCRMQKTELKNLHFSMSDKTLIGLNREEGESNLSDRGP